MTKLVGKLKQSYRAWQYKRRVTVRLSPMRRPVRRRQFLARAYVTHFPADNSGRYLCGRIFLPYMNYYSGPDRPAHGAHDTMCNDCQREINRLVGTPEGRKRLTATGG